MPNQDVPAASEGLRVIMRAISGLTPPDLLEVPFLFQCPPLDNFEEQFAFQHNDYMTAFAGERSRAAGRQLATYPFDTLFIDDIPGWSLIQDYVPNLIQVKRELKAIHDDGHPFQLLIHQMPLWGYYDVNVAATLRSMNVSQKAGETDARYFSLSFREYRDVQIDQTLKGGAPPVATAVGGPRTLQVDSLPDTQRSLQLLAKRFLGSSGDWTRISDIPGNQVQNIGPSDDLRDAMPPNAKITIPGVPQRLQLDEDVPELTFSG